MKNWGGHFTPELGGQFELESGGHFKLELGGQYHRNMHFDVLIINIFAMLLFFIIRFHYMIYKLNKSICDDE